MSNWWIANARLTAFVAPDAIVPPTLWQAVLGEEPETTIVQREAALRIESGPFAEGKLTLQVQPIRIDWVHEPAGMGEGGQPVTLGRFPAAAEPLPQLGRQWIESEWFPSVQRMALGFVLTSPTRNNETGYGELRRFIDGVPSSPDAADFLYQVNRARPSRVGLNGIHVNRLSRWSVGAYQFVALAPGSPHPIESPLQYHLRLELDISTSAHFRGLIPPEAAAGLIHDLFNGAQEISEQGNRF
jgi:hypothetical protein